MTKDMLTIDLPRALRDDDYRKEISDEIEGYSVHDLRHDAADEIERLSAAPKVKPAIWSVKTKRDDGDVCEFTFVSENQFMAFLRLVRASASLEVVEIFEKATVEAWTALEMANSYEVDE